MLISLSRKFVFVANLKTASTAIEKVLKSHSELALVESRFGKHQPFKQIEARFGWMLSLIDPGELFVFGVIRDPIDYVVSLYNSHTDPGFADDSQHYSGNLGFDEFLEEWAPRNDDQIKQQHPRFLDKNGCIAANYIISYDKLREGLQFVSERIGVKALVSLSRENESYGSLERSNLSARQREWIEARFTGDRELLGQYCDRLLTARPYFGHAEAACAPQGQFAPTPQCALVPDIRTQRKMDNVATSHGGEWVSALRSKLALAFILRDEGKYALEMLRSIVPIVGFVSYLDTGSTDNSAYIITEFLKNSEVRFSVTSTRFSRFDAMRNEAIAAVPVEFEWIFMLDADEIILEEDFRNIFEATNQSEVDAWDIPRFNWIDRIFGRRTPVYPDYQGRLFRNYPDKRIRYNGDVHETLVGFKNKAKIAVGPEPSRSVHIHHLKLFQKTAEERLNRESQYRDFYQARIKEARRHLLEKLWYGKDPFENASLYEGREDFQGWASDHPYLKSSVDEIRPGIVIEIGVWKGGSTITMARRLKQMGFTGLIIAVDTWLGSWDHWLQPEWFGSLRMENGYPTLFRTFLANIVKSDLQHYVIPLPLDSNNAAQILKRRGIAANLIHLDAAHDYDSVVNDLRIWWPLLSVGGIFIGDDYDPNGGSWPEVKRAFQDFFQTTDIENRGGKCLIRKVAQSAANPDVRSNAVVT